MMIVDVVLLILLLALAGRGWRLGFVEPLGELLGAILAFLVARAFSPAFGTGTARFIAVVVAKVVGTLFHWASKFLRIITALPLIHFVNNVLGAILGFLAGIVLVGSATYIVLFYRLNPTLELWLGGSWVSRWCEAAFSSALRFLL